MGTPWLLLDCDNLLHRNYHAMGGQMSHHEVSTGMLFGFLRDLRTLSREFATERFAFCFDSRKSLRAELCPSYKANRSKTYLDPMERKNRDVMHQQIESLRTTILPALGYKNVFHQDGYEADDLIASVIDSSLNTPHEDDDFTIISTDKDLLQLLIQADVWRPPLGKTPGELVNIGKFKKQYGINPTKWAKVKAIAGCDSDNIKGLAGVGEATALKYVRGELPEKRLAHKQIESYLKSDLYQMNKKLVRLPFEGTAPCPLVEDKLDRRAWNDLCRELGINTLRML